MPSTGLADPTCRHIPRRCAADEPSVSRLARAYPMSFAAVQKHVAVLERAGLVTKELHGASSSCAPMLARSPAHGRPSTTSRRPGVGEWTGCRPCWTRARRQRVGTQRSEERVEHHQRRHRLRQPDDHPDRRLRRGGVDSWRLCRGAAQQDAGGGQGRAQLPGVAADLGEQQPALQERHGGGREGGGVGSG
jgi:hypothetical protein